MYSEFKESVMWFMLFYILSAASQELVAPAGNVTLQAQEDIEDIEPIYYDMFNKPVPKLSKEVEVSPSLKQGALRYGWLPCTCQTQTCGCCSNLNINYLNFKRRGCMNFTYDPKEFALNMDVLMNDKPVYHNSVSGKNPPPACIPFAPVAFLPGVEFCIRMYNIYTPGQNIHACVNLETQIVQVPLLVLQFDCFRLGADGFAVVKPNVENAGLPAASTTMAAMLPIEEPEPQTEAQTEFYDEVTEDKKYNRQPKI